MKIPSVFQNKPLITTCDCDCVPVTIFEKLYRGDSHAFLYESMENEQQQGRYSIVGGRPGILFQSRKRKCRITIQDHSIECPDNPFSLLESIVRSGAQQQADTLFCGGAVGYIAYDAVRHIEAIPDIHPEDPALPEFYFLFPTEIILCDHRQKTVCVICYGDAQRLQELIQVIQEPARDPDPIGYTDQPGKITPIMDQDRFCSNVEQAKQFIHRGDVFQVVLSHRYIAPMSTEPFKVYQNLRITNPSPYMYYMKLNELAVLGSSPETLIKLQDNQVISVPIAGTRPRGSSCEQDQQLAHELLNDEKERAEHIMLVDLARNDVGRVSRYGSVNVEELMKVERYSKVMHMASRVTGDLKQGLSAFDVLRAAFPAGTVSGAPKVRAMQIIDELETTRRGIYAGAIGYFGFDGNMDFCIAIRTIVIHERTAYIQSGAGIVADSVPQTEYVETLHKMEALRHALEITP